MDPLQTAKTAISHAKAYEKITVPKFPKNGETTNWMMQLGINLCTAGGYSDQAEIPWLKEVYKKTFDELAESGSERMAKCDIALNTWLCKMIGGTQEGLKKDLVA